MNDAAHQRAYAPALAVLAVLFACTTAWLGAPHRAMWNSPDETANAFWSERVASFEPLSWPDDAVAAGGGAVHPRSFGVAGGALVPGSFPGLFLLYGALHGLTRLPLFALTPILTACAGLMLFGIWKRLFGAGVAAVATALFFAHPAVFYYASRGLFHNVLFLDLVIVAGWCFLMRPWQDRVWLGLPPGDVSGGLLLGLAVTTRASEAVWLLPAAIACAALVPKAERRARLPAAALGFSIGLSVLLAFNAATYGHPFRTSYVPPAATEAAVSDAAAAGPSPLAFLLPFGFHPKNIVRHVAVYGFAFFWWYTAALAFGLVWAVRAWRGWSSAARRYAIVALAVACWLAVLYGSWYVRDHWDPARVTIGTSYVRYFLPAYVAALPAAAGGILLVARRLRPSRTRFAAGSLVALLAVLSLRLAVFEGDESLLSVRATLRANVEKKAVLLAAIPPHAVVMTERFDKVLFPERPRIIPGTDPASFAAAARLSSELPVFFYGPTLPADLQAALEARAAASGAYLMEAHSLVPGETLFRLLPAEAPETP